MKKIKWILLAITLALAGLFLFATCRKTKAYTIDFETPIIDQHYDISASQNGGFSCIMSFDKQTVTYLLNIYDKTSSASYYVVEYREGVFRLYSGGAEVNSFNVSSYNTHIYYIQLCYDYVNDYVYLYISPILFNIVNRQDDSPIINEIYINLNNNYALWQLTNINFLSNYLGSQPSTAVMFSYANIYKVYSLMQLYFFNIQDNFSDAVDEQYEFMFEDIKNDIPINYYNYLIDTYYYSGYNAGYNTGYLEGDTAGYNRGFNEGYTDGYQDGQEDTQLYQNGYRDGYTAGYSDGEMSTDAYTLGYNAGYDEGERNGYRNGYQSGYLYGYEQGQAGENAITPAFSVISSVFGVVASVMSIQLFPGITIGLLILVPLFFAVLGLILWIWRRN